MTKVQTNSAHGGGWRLILVLGVVFALVLSYLFVRQTERERSLDASRATLSANQFAEQVETFFDLRVAALEAASHSTWKNRAEFERYSRELQDELRGFQALNRMSRDGELTWVVPRETNLGAEGKNVRENEVARLAFDAAIRNPGNVEVTAPTPLYQGGIGLSTYIAASDGVISGVFRLEPAIYTALEGRGISGAALRIVDEATDTVIFEHEWRADIEKDALSKAPIRFLDQRWRLELAPVGQMPAGAPIEPGVFVIAVVVSILMIVLLLWRRQPLARSMNGTRQRILAYAVGSMSIASFGLAVLAIYLLYLAAFQETERSLSTLVESQATLVDLLASHELEHEPLDEGIMTRELVRRVRRAHHELVEDKTSRELLIARRNGDQIEFLGGLKFAAPQGSLDFGSPGVEAMSRALRGMAGTTITTDYRGERVLAAYRHIEGQNLGMVAKIDMAEVRRPYIDAALATFALGLLVIALGGVFIWKLLSPLVARIEEERRDAVGAREEATELNRYLVALLESSPDFMYIKDDVGRIVAISQSLATMLGYESWRDVVGKSNFDLFPEELARDYFVSDWQVLIAGDATLKETPYVNAAGEKRWVRDFKGPLKDESGEVVGIVGISADVTERIEKREELIEQRARLRAVIDAMNSPLFMKREDGTYQLTNIPFDEAFLDGESAVGLEDSDIFDEANASRITLFSQRVIEEQELVTFELTVEERIYDITLAPLSGSNHGASVVGLANDVTQERQLADELIAARNSAHSANLAKSEFLANMSHEIRTPLHAVIGLADLLSGTELSDQQKDYQKKIGASATHLLQIINDILDFSKIEAGRLELDESVFEPGELVEHSLSLVAYRAEAKGLSIHADVDGSVPAFLSGDFMRIGQILTNFVDNAIKFTKSGRIDIRLRADPASDDETMLTIEVEDTGIGLSPDQLDKLFVAFSQADTSTTREFGGTGLGLSIVQRLVTLMHGEAGASSEEGVGSTFWASIRLGVSEEPSWQHVSEPEENHSESSLKGRRVLVVEDNAINQQVAVETLRRLEIESSVATNGLRAVELCSEGDFDLILMDIQMPTMGGIEATRRIRNLDGYSSVPIIALTANAMMSDRKKYLGAGMDGYLAKPINVGRLAGAISQFLEIETSVQGAHEAPVDESSILDVEAGSNRLGADFLLELLEQFREEHLERCETLEAWDEADTQAVSSHAHALKGVAATVSADRLAEAAGNIQTAIHDGMSLEDIAEMRVELEEVLERTRQAVDEALR